MTKLKGIKINKRILQLLVIVILIKAVLFWWGFNNFNFTLYPHEDILSIWNRWDSRAYITLAQEWYLAPQHFLWTNIIRICIRQKN